MTLVADVSGLAVCAGERPCGLTSRDSVRSDRRQIGTQVALHVFESEFLPDAVAVDVDGALAHVEKWGDLLRGLARSCQEQLAFDIPRSRSSLVTNNQIQCLGGGWPLPVLLREEVV